MKRFLLLLLVALFVGVTQSNAETIDITLANKLSGNSYLSGTFSQGGYSFYAGNMMQSGQIRANQDNASTNFYLYNTTAIKGIEKIEIVFGSSNNVNSTEASSFTLRTSDSSITSSATGSIKGTLSGTNVVLEAEDKTQSFFRVDLAKIGGTRIPTKIIVTYGSSGGEVTPPVEPDPTPGGESGSYTIVFANNSTANDGSIYNSSTINKAIETGGEYVSDITGYTNAYPGKSGFGLKLGTGSSTGDFTFSLSEKGKVHATKLVFSAASYNTSDKASLKVTLNGSKVFTEPLSTSHTNLEDFVFTIEGGIDLETIKFESTTKRANIKSITVYYGDNNSDKTSVTLSYDEDTYTATKGEAFNAPKLNVTPSEAMNAVSYKTDNTNVATVDANGAVMVKELGKTTVKAEISDNKTYADASASYTLNVIKNGEYTVAEALTAIKNGYEGKAQVKGIIISIDEISEQYKNATYNISDDATGTNSLQVFRGKWLDGADFNGNEIQVGGTIVVEGDLTNYNGTLEVGTGNVVISYIPPVTVAEDFTGFDKYEDEGIELEVGDEFPLDLGDKYPTIAYDFDEDGIISITDNKVKALTEGAVIVTASWNADDNWTAGSVEFMVDVTAAQLGEIIATVSDGTELVNNGIITITEGTTITFTAKNANRIYLYSEIDEVEEDGSTLVWTPTLCEDEIVMVEASMDSENTQSSATSSFEFTLSVTEKQAEKGSEQNPYTVAEFNENFSSLSSSSSKIWVLGYIGGSMVNNNPVFGEANNHANTNLVLSDDADASSNSLYIPVELPSGNVRTNVNVQDNADNIGRKVMLYGSAATYFTKNGLKSVTNYKFLDEKTPDPVPSLYFTFKGEPVSDRVELDWNTTEFPTLVLPDGITSALYTSSDTGVAEINSSTGEITLKGVKGETTISATTEAVEGQWNTGSASYTLVVLDPNATKATFVFTTENPYGMTTTDKSNTFFYDEISFSENKVKMTVTGKYRSWAKTNGYDFRIYTDDNSAIRIDAPAGYMLETIEFNGSSLNNLTTTTGTYNNGVWESKIDEVDTSVIFTPTGSPYINTITVWYTLDPYFYLMGTMTDNKTANPSYRFRPNGNGVYSLEVASINAYNGGKEEFVIANGNASVVYTGPSSADTDMETGRDYSPLQQWNNDDVDYYMGLKSTLYNVTLTWNTNENTLTIEGTPGSSNQLEVTVGNDKTMQSGSVEANDEEGIEGHIELQTLNDGALVYIFAPNNAQVYYAIELSNSTDQKSVKAKVGENLTYKAAQESKFEEGAYNIALTTGTSGTLYLKYGESSETASDPVAYSFSVERSTPTSVEDIDAEEAEVEYYDLNGFKVDADRLDHGIYIRVTGRKVEKILL